MVSILKMTNGASSEIESTANNLHDESEAEDEWQEVQRGAKNKGVVTR